MGPNTIIIKDFFPGEHTNTTITDTGELFLSSGKDQGSYQSPVLTGLPSFKDVVASWNSTTGPQSSVELLVRVEGQTGWSNWFSYGQWSDKGYNLGSLKEQKDEIGHLDVDLLQVLAAPGQAVQFKLELRRHSQETASPQVRLVAFTFNPAVPSKEEFQLANVSLQVPPRAQLPIPEIGRIICSPTSLSMVMEYHGLNEATEQVAAGVKDNGANIYGNWSYNTAYAGERGFAAWVERCNSIKEVQDYLQQGLPVIASIRIKDKEELTGAIMPYASGHLLVITGLVRQDGQDYVLVNDPAANSDQDVPRQYPLEQFLKAWSRKRIYLVQKQQ